MGRFKKQQEPPALPVEAEANKAETIIIPDVQKLPAGNSRRRSIQDVQPDEIVTVHNKQNGAVNRMAAKNALKLVERNPEGFELMKTPPNHLKGNLAHTLRKR